MRNGYVGTGGFPPPGGPCAGVPGGLHPRTGLESPSDHVRPEGGAAGCTEGPDSPSEVGCGRCAGRGLCIQGGASRTADPPSGWADALGRGVSGGAGGRAPHRLVAPPLQSRRADLGREAVHTVYRRSAPVPCPAGCSIPRSPR